MALGDVEEHKKIGRLLIMALLAFSSCNHLVKAVRLPTAGDSNALGALTTFSVNFNAHVLSPLDHFRLEIGELVSSAGRICPDAMHSTCEAGTTGIRFVLGLH